VPRSGFAPRERRCLVYFYVLLLAANRHYEWDCVDSGARSVSDKRPGTHTLYRFREIKNTQAFSVITARLVYMSRSRWIVQAGFDSF
jgi:hypothetical protein